MDKWALAKVNAFVKEANKDFSEYHVERLMRKFEKLLDEMSNWYVRRSRRRFWKSENDSDKLGAYYTLYTVLRTIITTVAPILPFLTEDIYQNLVLSVDKDAPESVHLQDFPKADEALIDNDLLNKIDTIIKAVEMGRSARNKANIRTRQPLANMLFKARNAKEKAYITELEDQIKEELNIKKVTLIDSIDEYVSYDAKPNFRHPWQEGRQRHALDRQRPQRHGRRKSGRHGSKPDEAVSPLPVSTSLTDDINIVVNEKEGVVAVEDKGYVAILDVTLTEELKQEGLVRDLVRHIQTLRKEADFNVDDRIELFIDANDDVMTCC